MEDPKITDDSKFQRAASKSSTELSLVYGCDSCKITNLSHPTRMCPCPRGCCDAKVIGREKIIKQFYKIK